MVIVIVFLINIEATVHNFETKIFLKSNIETYKSIFLLKSQKPREDKRSKSKVNLKNETRQKKTNKQEIDNITFKIQSKIIISWFYPRVSKSNMALF